MGSRQRWVAALAAFALACVPPAAHADCKRMRTGAHVVLYSTSDDPDVLAWDSRSRLRDYHAASFDVAEQLLPHATIELPGTRAMIESCVPAFVQSPSFSGPEDAVGIIILDGSDKGHGRWVLGSDVSPAPPPKHK